MTQERLDQRSRGMNDEHPEGQANEANHQAQLAEQEQPREAGGGSGSDPDPDGS